MPLPVAHACIGASLARVLAPNADDKFVARLLGAAALLAVVPDLDFFLLWVLKMSPGWHRGFSHSITFSAAVALLASLLLFKSEWRRAFPALWAAMASHCLMDMLTSRLASGPELFWPFSSLRWRAGFFDYLDFSIKVRHPLEFPILFLKISVVEALLFFPFFLAICVTVNRIKSGRATDTAIQEQEAG